MELKDVRGGLCGQEKDVEEPTSFQEASTCLENQAKTSWEFLERYFKVKTTNIYSVLYPGCCHPQERYPESGHHPSGQAASKTETRLLPMCLQAPPIAGP